LPTVKIWAKHVRENFSIVPQGVRCGKSRTSENRMQGRPEGHPCGLSGAFVLLEESEIKVTNKRRHFELFHT